MTIGRNTNAELGEIEIVMIIVFVGDGIAGTNRGWRLDVVKETTLLVIGDEKHAIVPMG